MKNVNEILTGEQINMLRNDLCEHDLLTLFLMNAEEKYDFIVNCRAKYAFQYNELKPDFEKLHSEFVNLKDDKIKAFNVANLMHDVFVNMSVCCDYMDMYDTLLKFI